MSNGNGDRVELDIKYRPKTLDEVIGQPSAVNTVRGFGEVIPRALLLYGTTGAGKTTIARIIASMADVGRMDYSEINCGSVKSAIEMVRDIQSSMSAAPMGGKKRMWVLDEVQTLSRQKFAQEALLKVLEDCPTHVLFALCTTDPQRLLKAIQGRCVKIPVKPIRDEDLEKLVRKVAGKEKIQLTDRVVDKIVSSAEGSARNALKELEKLVDVDDEREQLSLISVGTSSAEAFDLAKALVYSASPNWKEVASLLVKTEAEAPETTRQVILACARNEMLKNAQKAGHCFKVISALSDPFYDVNSGKALLAAACYRICFAQQR